MILEIQSSTNTVLFVRFLFVETSVQSIRDIWTPLWRWDVVFNEIICKSCALYIMRSFRHKMLYVRLSRLEHIYKTLVSLFHCICTWFFRNFSLPHLHQDKEFITFSAFSPKMRGMGLNMPFHSTTSIQLIDCLIDYCLPLSNSISSRPDRGT
jgi:hypothetical protein